MLDKEHVCGWSDVFLNICRNMDLNIVVVIGLDMNFQMRNYWGLVNLMHYLLRCEKMFGKYIMKKTQHKKTQQKKQQKRRGGKTQKRRREMKRKSMNGGEPKYFDSGEIKEAEEYTLYFFIDESRNKRAYEAGKIYLGGRVSNGVESQDNHEWAYYTDDGAMYNETLGKCASVLFTGLLKSKGVMLPRNQNWETFFSNKKYGVDLDEKDIFIYKKLDGPEIFTTTTPELKHTYFDDKYEKIEQIERNI